MKKYKIATLFRLGILATILLLSACDSNEPASPARQTTEEAIIAAVRDYLATQGGPGNQVEVEIDRLEGDFARVMIVSTDPGAPGGFTGFLGRENGAWRTLIVGSGFNPMEIQSLGIPESILPEGWILPEEETDKVAGNGDNCPSPMADTQLLAEEVKGFCLLYPASHIVVQLESGNIEIVVGSVTNHTDPRVSITVEELAGRTLEQVVKAFLADYEGFEVARTVLTVAGEEAILLDGIPGQDFYRKFFVAHGGSLYQIAVAPYDQNLVDTFPQAEQLSTLIIESFRFMTS